MELASSYDYDAWELTIYIDNRKYVYTGVSPFHNSEFVKRAKRNKGRALAYIRKYQFRRKDEA